MKVCFSIAVSRPEGQLDELPGAIQASKDFVNWANAAKFDRVVSITDEARGSSVTVADLRAAFKKAIGNAAEEIDHLVVHFAGHGFADNVDDQLLLLSKWQTETTEAIKLSRFVMLLQFYQPKRVSLLLDACRSDKPREADQLQGSGVLEKPRDAPIEFLEDRFRPAAARAKSFMIPGRDGEPARCVFSTVLLKALSGAYPEALEDRGAGKAVTSAGIYDAMNRGLKEVAALHKLALTPSLHPGFVRPNDVYVQMPIEFVPPELPPPVPETPIRGVDVAKEIIEPLIEKSDIAAKIQAAELRREYDTEQRPTHYETGAGLALVGAKPKGDPSITPPGSAARDRAAEDGSTWWRLGAAPDAQRPLTEPSSLLLEIDNGVWVGAAAFPGRILTVTIAGGAITTETGCQESSGAVSLIYRPMVWAEPLPQHFIVESKATEKIVADLRAGALTADAALSLAVQLRETKHFNPALGAIAAYLYDAAGDRDSIRRIAWFYPDMGQPIPFDVALLAGAPGVRDEHGRIYIDLLNIPARAPRTAQESQHPDYFAELPAVTRALVAGGFPWLRQGWSLLDVAQLPTHPGVVELAPHVLSAPFTTLDHEAGRRLADLIQKGEV